MITTIIFDIGNVMVGFTWREHIAGFGYDDGMVERIGRATVLNPAWIEVDKGIMSREEVLREFIAADPEIERDIRKVMENVRTIVSRRDYVIPWIQDLKSKGYRTLYLSNFSEQAEADCADALDFIPYMDGGIISYKEKVIKPMPEIYERLIERYQLVPEECVFMDDMPENLAGAEKFGIHTIQFQSQAQAVEELRRLGVDA